MFYQEEILPFLEDLWAQQKDKYPNLPWAVLSYDAVRIEIADVLLQARRNRKIKFDPGPMEQFAINLLNTSDVWTKMSAANVLGLTETDEAVAALMTEAVSVNRSTFRVTVVSLARMYNPSAQAALEALLKQNLRESSRMYVLEQKTAWNNLKQKHQLCYWYQEKI
jgi:hypothetical protein